jgi:hypothetical protein
VLNFPANAPTKLSRAENAFALEIDFQPGVGDPSRIFQTAIDLIKEIKVFDRELAKSIDVVIRPQLLLQEVEEGSLRIWLITALHALDDDALKSGDWKKLVGSFLFKAKYKFLEYLQASGDDLRGDALGLEAFRAELLREIQELEVSRIPNPVLPPKSFFVQQIVQISTAVSSLAPNERVLLEAPTGERVEINRSIHLSQEDIERLTTLEEKSFDSEVILPVKKPDFLGSSKWEFVYEGHSIEAKMLDGTWMDSFRHKKIPLLPGASLQVLLRQNIAYGSDNEQLGMRYSILQVFRVVDPPDDREILTLFEG